MNTKAELIVLNHTKFGENSIVLHTISNEYGRKGFLVRLSSKNSMALFLPMNILEAEISENPKSQLWRVSNFVCLSPLNGIRGDIRKNTMTVFMSEVLYRAILENTNEGGLASWLKQEILTLDALESDFSNFHLLFLLDLCSALGFRPSISGLAPFAGTQLSNIEALLRNYYRTFQGFSSHDGISQSASLQGGLSQSSFSQDNPQGSSTGLAKALMQPLRGTDRNEIAEAIIRYISYHTETSLNIRSLAILREIFG
ncbi:MAG: recombination protein O N-terminal domain-containing protein [Bacteroidales bacterium]|nr:recombination protein O N-terminal domain-containing protein [Bacteroidales bacterium]MDY6001539.1 recombination protein O N-terminal domain-containing protein [Candidatus Cryptobacteroides sp.]